MKIPQHQIEQIRDSISIVEVVEDYVALKRRGRNYFGLCPFHQEDTASFSVNEERNIFKCFGCGKGGSVFQFLQEYEKLSFPEAVQKLADRAGITLEIQKSSTPEEKDKINLLFDANEFAVDFYNEMLKSEKGKTAREYLEARKFKSETLKIFQVGFALDEWGALVSIAEREGFTKEILVSAGLAIRKEQGGIYDRFRNRLMFPICNIADRVVGFGGRSMEKDDPAKYLNTSETMLYQKSKLLFGLGKSKGNVRDKDSLILVEGYTDVLRLWENGFQNIAASSGTSMTPYHAKIISRFSENIYLLFDGDTAGVSAAIRAGKILQFSGLNPRIVLLPMNHDPDSFVQKNGSAMLRKMLKSASDFFPFFFDQRKDQIRTVSGKIKVIEELLEDLTKVRDWVRRDLYVSVIAQNVGVSEVAIMSKINLRLRGKKQEKAKSVQTVLEKHKIHTSAERAQYELFRLIIAVISGTLEIREIIPQKVFTHPIIGEIIKKINDSNISNLGVLLDSDLSATARDMVSGLIIENIEISNPEQLVRDCLKTIKIEKINAELSNLKSQIRDAEKQNKDVSKLFEEQMELRKKKREI